MTMTSVDFTSDCGKRALGRLESEQVVWLTTTSPNGTPQPSPVWFLWDDDAVLIFSQPNTPKLKGIGRNERVSLNFNATEHGGDIVILQGSAEIVGEDPPATSFPAYLTKYAGGFESLKMSPEAFAAEYSQLIRVSPDRLRGW
jgi:PPOX class probable F420-dependent enzyme